MFAESFYVVMRKIPSYRLEHFFDRDKAIYACQFFALLELIREEQKQENKKAEELRKKARRRR